jgi:hypothetical protein
MPPFTAPHRRPRQISGSALVIVLILLSLMATLMVSNAVALRRLKLELQLLEEKQKRVLEKRISPASPLRPFPADGLEKRTD